MQLCIGDRLWWIEIQRKPIKNLILRVAKEGDRLLVSAPQHVDQKTIEQFILSRQKWIEKTWIQIEHRRSQKYWHHVRSGQILFFGKKVPFRLEKGQERLLHENDGITLWTRVSDPEAVQQAFERQAVRLLQRRVEERRIELDARLAEYRQPAPTVSFRKMRSRWGSCIPSKGKVTLNTNLIYYPEVCLDYVLVHEFAHLIIPNHSRRFYQVVENWMPEYRQAQQWLREK